MYDKVLGFARSLSHEDWVGLFRTVNDHQYIAISDSMATCSTLHIPNCATTPTPQFACMLKLHERHALAPPSRAPPRAYATYANAQFGVTRELITSRPLAFWAGLLAEFEVEEEKACYRIGPGAHKARPHRGTCAQLEYMCAACRS